MVKYLKKAKSLISGFANFSISQVPRSKNKKVDTLSKISSTSFAHLSKQVLVEVLKEKSIQEEEVATVVEEEGPTWMTPIIEYLKDGTLPNDKKEARKLRIKARQYELLEGVLYRRSFLKSWLRCVGPLQANYVIRLNDVQLQLNAAKLKNQLVLPVQVPVAEALIDKKKMIITESSIRRDLHLEDAEGTDCLPTTTIFEELAKMGAKSTAWNEFSSTMASLIICLATNQKFNLSKYIFDAMVKHLNGGVKFLMYPRFLQVFINQQLRDMSHYKKIYVNPSYIKNFFAKMKRAGKDFSGRITPLFDTMMVQASKQVDKDSDHPTDSNQIPIVDQPSTSSQPKKKQKFKRKQRKEAKVAHDETKHEESVPTPYNDPLPSGKDSMKLNDLMVLCTKLQKQVLDLEKAKSDQAIKIASLKKREDASKQGRRIKNIDADAEVTLVNETQERQDEDLMFDTGVLDDDEMFMDATTGEKDEQSTKIDDSTTGEAITTAGVEDSALPIIPTILERPLTKKDQVALDEDLARNIQAQLDAEIIEEERLERLLAERTQTRERAELTDEEKGKLFMELMKKRRKHFAALRAQEKRNKPPTKAQKRSKMSTYLKHMGSEEKAKSSRKKSLGKKRAVKEQQQESTKRQKLEDDKETDEHEEVEADDTAELKKHLVIKKDDDIAIDVIPLATKPPVIVDYKLFKEGIMGIDREDLQTLWKLVKTKHGDLRPKDEHERVLWGDLKVMFEPDIRSNIFMLVEKRYILTPITITNMLNKKLQTDHWNEMCYQLLKLMNMNIKFRRGLLGLKRLQGFLLLLRVSTASTYYCLCSVYAAGYKDTTVAELQLLEDLLLSRG
ncbi:hypothetical protein Tco_0523367 [Tanacetum coccineum]